MRSIWIAVALGAALLFVACNGDDDGTAEPTPTSTATPTATPTDTPTSTPTPIITPTPEPLEERALETAAAELERWLGPLAGPVTATRAERMTWPDGCLGLGHGGEACTEALVEGWLVTVTMGSVDYRIRTDLESQVLRWEPETQVLVRYAESVTNVAVFTTDDGNTIEPRLLPGTQFDFRDFAPGDPAGIAIASAPQGGAPILVWADPVEANDSEADAAASAALAALAGWLGVDASSLVIHSTEAVDWPDGCLGIMRPGLFCTQAIRPGFRVTIDSVSGDQRYNVHTDRAAAALVWDGPLGGAHTFVSATADEVTMLPEGGTVPVPARLVPGSDVTVDLADLAEGDAIWAWLAPDPDGDNFVVVSLDLVEE
jgi:hypothetical protein